MNKETRCHVQIAINEQGLVYINPRQFGYYHSEQFMDIPIVILSDNIGTFPIFSLSEFDGLQIPDFGFRAVIVIYRSLNL